MGVVALKLVGVVNKSGRGRKIFRAHFTRRLFSTLLDEILDTPLLWGYLDLSNVLTTEILDTVLAMCVHISYLAGTSDALCPD